MNDLKSIEKLINKESLSNEEKGYDLFCEMTNYHKKKLEDYFINEGKCKILFNEKYNSYEKTILNKLWVTSIASAMSKISFSIIKSVMTIEKMNNKEVTKNITNAVINDLFCFFGDKILIGDFLKQCGKIYIKQLTKKESNE